MTPSALNAYVNGAWTPVDLRGPMGDQGSAGAAGSYTWPASNFQNYTNTKSMGDGVQEPGPLTQLTGTGNAGTSPATRVYAGDTRRIEALKSGTLFVTYNTGMGSAATTDSWFNIRRVTGDIILASAVVMVGETHGVVSAIMQATVGDVFSFVIYKVTSNTLNVDSVIRTVLLV